MVLKLEKVSLINGDKQYKEYLPFHLRRIIGLEIEKNNTIIMHCCISRGKDKDGSDLKKIALEFGDVAQARSWRDNMMELVFGGFYEKSLQRKVLFLLEKSDKDSMKLIEKYVIEVFKQAKKEYQIETVQYNEFSVRNVFDKLDLKSFGNIICTSESFLPRIQQVLVRNQLCTEPISFNCESDPVGAALDIIRSCIGKTKISSLYVAALNLKRKDIKVLGMFKMK
jgi:hypothetical protein